MEVCLDKIEISAESRAVKECDRPDEKIVAEIRAWIKASGSPHTFRLHTHTKPPKGTPVIYIEEFTLPKQYRVRNKRAPCPCCTDVWPQYWHLGKIAYFPLERVLRLVGPDCYAALDAEGHQIALNTMREERKRRQDIAAILNNPHLIPQLTARLIEWLPIITAFDNGRKGMRERLDMLRLPLWSRIRDGQLHVSRAREIVFKKPDGTDATRTVHDMQVYGPVAGYAFFAPDAKPYTPRLKRLQTSLSQVPTFRPENIPNLSDQERRYIAKTINQATTTMRDILNDITDLRRIFEQVSISTINGWSRDPGADFPIHFAVDNTSLYIGRTADNRLRIPVAPEFWQRLRSIPQMAETSMAAE